jgi:Na+/H+ antiporter NhaD/arsenite permease-like protein
VLIEVCDRRRLDPVPFLLALACAANVGSAATLIGNPQNMLIGQRLDLSFAGYLGVAGPIALVGLAATWGVITWQHRGRWAVGGDDEADHLTVPMPAFDRWETGKGLVVAVALLVLFLFSSVPREVAALAGAGVLLTSRRLHSRDMLGLVDWQLLVLFAGLFVVNHAFQQTAWPGDVVTTLAAAGADPAHPGWLFGWTVVLSNAVSNVPAVMLLLPLAEHPMAGPLLALSSTFAGNLLIVGSIANIIVVDGAARQGVTIDWKRHARTGIPVTLVTLVLAAVGMAISE